jgi:hypothetical protein
MKDILPLQEQAIIAIEDLPIAKQNLSVGPSEKLNAKVIVEADSSLSISELELVIKDPSCVIVKLLSYILPKLTEALRFSTVEPCEMQELVYHNFCQ